jgi:hypothetical protein
VVITAAKEASESLDLSGVVSQLAQIGLQNGHEA